MNDKQLYAQILGISSPWSVSLVDLRLSSGELEVEVVCGSEALRCPKCNEVCPGYDSRRRQWRHLDTCQYRTLLTADVPRVECPEHGIRQVTVPWAAPGSRYTLLFEALVIGWLREASHSGVAKMMQLTWDQVDGIMGRAVKRGLRRRELKPPRAIGVDEKSFKKRQDYVTVVHDSDDGRVLHVADGRKKSALGEFYDQFTPEELECIEAVSMDMWNPYILSTKERVPDAKTKIAFDKFHIAQHLSKGVDKVRRQENKELCRDDDRRLVGTKYLWLESPLHMSDKRYEKFQSIKKHALRTARAWAMKEAADPLWYGSLNREDIEERWKCWLMWPPRCRMAPMIKVGKMIKNHLWGIVNAIVHDTTNAKAEGLNSVIQKLKVRACGFRNRKRFKNAIYFHLGRLDLLPKAGEA